MKKLLLASALAVAGIAGTALPASAGVAVGVYANFGPPAPVYERVPVAPGPSYVWQPGYYTWSGGSYVWIRGRYVRPPYRGAVWVAPRWNRYGGRWGYNRGYWRRPY
jgi:hypothetical protein